MLLLQVTGHRILVWQSIIPKGYVMPSGPGEMPRLPSSGEAIRCHYFTGRALISDVFPKGGPDGIDECPLLTRTRRPMP